MIINRYCGNTGRSNIDIQDVIINIIDVNNITYINT